MEIYLMNGLHEKSHSCYELDSFADVFLDFEEAKMNAQKMYGAILQDSELNIDLDEHFQLIEGPGFFNVEILADGIRFELFIAKKSIPL